MNLVQRTALAAPRSDGRRVLFEIEAGGHSVACAISITALQDLSGRRSFKPAELLRLFMESRDRIEAVAHTKWRTRPQGVTGLLNIWSDDVEDPPPGSEPIAMRRAPPRGEA